MKGHLHNSLCTCSAGCPDCRQTPCTQQAADLQGLSSKSTRPALHLVHMMHRSTSTQTALPHQFPKAQSNSSNGPASLQHQTEQASTSLTSATTDGASLMQTSTLLCSSVHSMCGFTGVTAIDSRSSAAFASCMSTFTGMLMHICEATCMVTYAMEQYMQLTFTFQESGAANGMSN